MDFLKELAIDWILFSLIEAFIICYFKTKIGKIGKYKITQIIITSIGNCLISVIFPPVMYQIIMILYMTQIDILFKKDITKAIKYSTLSLVFLISIETIYSIFLLNTINFDRFMSMGENYLFSFLLLIPIRILELLIIKFYKR